MGDPGRRAPRAGEPRRAARPVARTGEPSAGVEAPRAASREAARADALRRGAAVLDALGEPAFAVDVEGRVHHWNGPAEALLGWPAQEASRCSMTGLFDQLQAPGDLCAQVETALARAGSWRTQVDLVAHDGTPVATEMIAALLADDHGAPVGVVVRLRDVRTERATVRRMRDREGRYRSFVHHNADAIFGIDTSGLFTEVNPAAEQMSGRRADELVGTPFFPLVAPEEVDDVAQRFLAALEGETQRFETTIVRHDGRRLPLAVTAVPMIDDGAVTGIFGMARDLTETRAAEAMRTARQERLEDEIRQRTRALEAANEELQAFSYSVSHDLRAPLRGIDFYAQILEEDHGVQLDDEARDVVSRIRRESQRMSQLVRDLLQLGRAGREPLERREIDLTQIGRSIVEELRRANPQRKVEVVIEPGLLAHGDPRMARVVLENLLGNAWKYTGTREDAHIRLGRDPSSGAFLVEDNGIGFDDEAARSLFQPFQRLPNAAGFEGTGVGLATVDRIVRRHGGEVRAHGRPGDGATFLFKLPGTGEPDAGAAAEN